ncbi:iron uptake transporter permease EfeU [Catenulispora yoronensis]
MLPTFVIGLREGLEAALIVGIIAAFLGQQGRRDLLRWMYAGVAAAVLLCVAVGIGLEAASADLPQKQQEGLETVIGVLAVGMVTYMVVWMRRHSRELKKQLEGLAAQALEQGTAGRAMVLMAFLAVLREGFETVVFLLAAFHESDNTAQAGGGAVAGIAVAVLLGYGIYRGGVRLNLSKFFRATGIVLVLVAAGLVASALRTAHEAGWLNAGQQSTVDLSSVVRPGSVQSALLTGMLGIQSHPALIEAVGWLVYLVPIGLYIAWPPQRTPATRTLIRTGLAVAGAGAVTTAVLAFAAPTVRPADPPAATATFSLGAMATDGAPGSVTAQRSGTEDHNGLSTYVYTATSTAPATDRPAELTYEQAATLNGGRLPLGVRGPISRASPTSPASPASPASPGLPLRST